MRDKFDKIREQKIIEMYKDNMPLKEICKISPCSISTIPKVLKKYNIPTDRKTKYRDFDKFRKLTPIRYIINKKSNLTEVECLCECGNTIIIPPYRLKNGNTKSCGCLLAERYRRPPNKNANFNCAIRTYKKNAKKRNLLYEISDSDALKLMKSNCYYCNAVPANRYRMVKSCEPFIYNGIDRVDNTLGYIIDNCVPCCIKCNTAKSDMSMNEFKQWLHVVYNRIYV